MLQYYRPASKYSLFGEVVQEMGKMGSKCLINCTCVIIMLYVKFLPKKLNIFQTVTNDKLVLPNSIQIRSMQKAVLFSDCSKIKPVLS